jgi:hypothetical protein
MTTTTVTPSRRAALGALASIPTLALPAAAMAGSETAGGPSAHPDAELSALIERAKAAAALTDEANDTGEDVWAKLQPSRPQVLIWTEADAQNWCEVRSGELISNGNIDFLKLWLEIDRKPDPIAARLPVFPALAFVERAREIVRANDEFEAAWKVAKEHPDFLAAETRNEALSERWHELALRIATTPAKTTEGLIAKLAMVWPAYADDELDGTYDGVVASAVRDAHALVNPVSRASEAAAGA